MAITMRLPTTTASVLSCGRAPCPPCPVIRMSKASVEAFTVPGLTTMEPVG